MTQTEPQQFRIVIVDDHAFMRRALRILLEQDGMQIVGETDDEASTMIAVEKSDPHAVLLDFVLNDGDCLSMIPKLKKKKPALAIVVMSGYPHKFFEERAIKAGACGIYIKGRPPQELFQVIQSAINRQQHSDSP